MDQTMTLVMKGVSDALRLDGNNRFQEAYIKYLECILRVTTKLLQDTRKDGGQVTITKEVLRFVRLGQQCMDRIVAIVNQIDAAKKPTTSIYKTSLSVNLTESRGNVQPPAENLQQETRSAPCTPTDGAQSSLSKDSRARLFSAPVPPLPDSEKSVHKRNKGISPMEMAFIQNQQLMKAYKARLGRMNTKRSVATNLSLTIQRKMAENLAIAKAQEEALEKKMKERQERLEEQAAKKFISPIGMSEEEVEQKETYKKVLDYEQDTKWISDLRSKLEENPNDGALINQLVQEILRCSDHPLMEKLKQYQFKVYEQLYPLVINKMDRLQQIKVPLPQDLYPATKTSDKPDNRHENEGEIDSDKDIDTEQVKNDNDVTDGYHSDFSNENDDIDNKQSNENGSVTECVNSEKDKRSDDKSSLSVKEEVSDSFMDSEVSTFSSKQEQKYGTSSGNQESKDRKGESDKNKDELQDNESDSKEDNEKNSLIKEIEVCDIGEEEGGSEDVELRDYVTDRDLEDVTCDVLRDLEIAMEKGEKVQRQLKKTSETEIMNQISKDYDKYTEEDMDDLLDEIMEEDENNDSENDLSQSNLKAEKINSDTNQSGESLGLSQSKELKSAKKVTECDKSDQSETDILSDKVLTSKPKVPDSLVLNNTVEELRNEAYNRHLKGISSDIHNYLDKLMTLFTVSYEQLDTPEGRDQLCESLEGPFFKPLWPYLLGLFRLCNEQKETCLAYVMTTKLHSTPDEFGVIEELTLPDSSDANPFPYFTAIKELRSITTQYTLLQKLECLVKSFRLVCQCVEDYYQKDVDSGKLHKIPSIGADDLLPILCYMVVKTRLPQIISECQIMEEFLHEGYIIGEEGYCLTSMQTAFGYLLKQEL